MRYVSLADLWDTKSISTFQNVKSLAQEDFQNIGLSLNDFISFQSKRTTLSNEKVYDFCRSPLNPHESSVLRYKEWGLLSTLGLPYTTQRRGDGFELDARLNIFQPIHSWGESVFKSPSQPELKLLMPV